jgi:hypothetical protein
VKSGCLPFRSISTSTASRALGHFMQAAVYTEISALIGEVLPDEVVQLYSDLLRISLLRKISLPLAKPVVPTAGGEFDFLRGSDKMMSLIDLSFFLTM